MFKSMEDIKEEYAELTEEQYKLITVLYETLVSLEKECQAILATGKLDEARGLATVVAKTIMTEKGEL